MSDSFPRAFTPADLLALQADRRPDAIDRITVWLRQAQARRAERLVAQYICDANIADFAAMDAGR